MALISSTTTTLVLLTVSAAVFLLFPSAHYARSVGVRVGVESPVDMEDVGKSTIFVKNSQKLKLGSMRNHLDTILLPHDSHQDVAGGKKKPLVVFIHGLGGQISQWTRQLQHFSKTHHVFAVTNIGCGQSDKSRNPDDYTTHQIVQDLYQLITSPESPVNTDINYSDIFLIGHSYGTHLAIKLYLKMFSGPHHDLLHHPILGLALFAPPFKTSEKDSHLRQTLSKTPDFIINLFRFWDKIGGTKSKSVARFVSPHATLPTRVQQLKWNSQHPTPTLRYTVLGLSLATREECEQLNASLTKLLVVVAGEDLVIPPVNQASFFNTYFSNNKNNVLDRKLIHIQGAAHNFIFEDADKVNAIIDSFLQQQ